MEQIFLPTLSFWENGNGWYGSLGQARFHVQPQDGALSAQLWRGPLTQELSDVLETASFPQDEDGLARLAAWLEDQSSQLNHPQ